MSSIKRVTFVTPHLRPTSGGVWAICQFATELSTSLNVTVVVLRDDGVRLPGVTVRNASDLLPDQLPDADAIIVPADSPMVHRLPELPPSKGVPFLLLQGFGTPNNSLVWRNLSAGHRVLATSTWLMDAARAYARDVALIRYGIDRTVFHDDGPEVRFPRQVSLMTHHLEWKGTLDGILALEIVRRELPAVSIVMFGVYEPQMGGVHFVKAPAREDVASIMRHSAVFVCPSWEEGFGLPGLEAMQCGAALATTDTKGSRDYAFHEQTALVTHPRRPRWLATSIIRLLTDQVLREKLRRQGSAFVDATFGSWAAATSELRQALVRGVREG